MSKASSSTPSMLAQPSDPRNETQQYNEKLENVVFTTHNELYRWRKYETEYMQLQKTMLGLPDEIEHNVMIPIGKMAFMPGKLVHTNEILVLLGDNWFVERSARQASEIVDRRLDMVKKTIGDLETQLNDHRARLSLTGDVLNLVSAEPKLNEEGLPFVDIVEEYHSDDEKKASSKSVARSRSFVENPESVYDHPSLHLLNEFMQEEEQELSRSRIHKINAAATDSDDDENYVEPTSDYEDEQVDAEAEPPPVRPKKVSFADAPRVRHTQEEGGAKADSGKPSGSPRRKTRNMNPVKDLVTEKQVDFSEFQVEKLEDQIWHKEIAAEYHERRQQLIAQQGGLPSQRETIATADQTSQPQIAAPLTDQAAPPKKISRFKAARLGGKLG